MEEENIAKRMNKNGFWNEVMRKDANGLRIHSGLSRSYTERFQYDEFALTILSTQGKFPNDSFFFMTLSKN